MLMKSIPKAFFYVYFRPFFFFFFDFRFPQFSLEFIFRIDFQQQKKLIYFLECNAKK